MFRRSSPDMNGSVVVITGAARGIGAGLARSLAARGAKVALLGLEPTELAARASECGPESAWWTVDITDGEAMNAVADQVLAHYGRVDVVIANAGIAGGAPFRLSDPASFDRIIEVNLMGSVRTARAFVPALMASGGYFLQVSSAAAFMFPPMMAAYAASKAGVESFAVVLGIELRSHGVKVGVAYPSWIDTDMVRGGDAKPGLGTMRRALPGVLKATLPLDEAIALLVEGIERRARTIYVPGIVRWFMLGRVTNPIVARLIAGRTFPGYEKQVVDAGEVAGLPVGAGGAAGGAAALEAHQL